MQGKWRRMELCSFKFSGYGTIKHLQEVQKKYLQDNSEKTNRKKKFQVLFNVLCLMRQMNFQFILLLILLVNENDRYILLIKCHLDKKVESLFYVNCYIFLFLKKKDYICNLETCFVHVIEQVRKLILYTGSNLRSRRCSR